MMSETSHRRADDEQDHAHLRRGDPILERLLGVMEAVNASVGRMETSVHAQIDRLEDGQKQLTQHVYKLSVRLEAVENRHEETTGFLQNHAKVEEEVLAQQVEQIDAVAAKLSEIMRGFPRDPEDGERKPAFHADWHERDIKKSRDWSEVTKEIRKWAILGTLSALFGVLGTLLVIGAVESMRQAVGVTTQKPQEPERKQ